MPNDYYNVTTDFTPYTVVTSEDHDNEYTGIAAGFALLPSQARMDSGNTNYVVAGGTANALTITSPGTAITTYTGQDGLMFSIKATLTNPGATTINVDDIGAVPLVSSDGSAPAAGSLTANGVYSVVYNETTGKFVFADPLGSEAAASASAAAAAASETAAASSAAGVNLPSIGSGDALKILRANTGETGFELGSLGVNVVATGAISATDMVALNTDGTVSVITESSHSAGTAVVFETGQTEYVSSAYDSTNDKIVIAYRDASNTNYGTAVVGTVAGSAITFGTPVVFDSVATTWLSTVFDSSTGKIVIAYVDLASTSDGTAIVGTVSGTSISFGTPVVFDPGVLTYVSAVFDSTNNKVVIAYADGTGVDGSAVVGTVSGTSISFGTPVEFDTDAVVHVAAVFDSSAGKVLVSYKSNTYDLGEAIVGTVSGTSISFGSVAVFDLEYSVNMAMAYDSYSGKSVIIWASSNPNFFGKAIVATITGTSVSFGEPATYNSAYTTTISSVAYDTSSNKVVIAYKDTANSNYGTAIVGTVSGTSISFGTPVVFESGDTDYTSTVYDSSSSQVVISYEDFSDAGIGRAIVLDPGTTNAAGFLGVAQALISDGVSGNVTALAGVSEGHTGLTIGSVYYVNAAGSLTTSSTNAFLVGRALSATNILIGGA